MTDEEKVVLILKGHISNLTSKQQAAIYEARDQILAIARKSEESLMGATLASAEIAAEQ